MNVINDRAVTFRRAASLLLACAIAVSPAGAQTTVRIDPAQGPVGWLTRPHRQRYVPPSTLANRSRLDQLLRAGNLYLSAQDVVALALENSLDIEVQRYAPLLAREVLRRAEGGGLLRNPGQGVAAGPVSVSLAGVSVHTNGAASGATSGVSSSVLTQLGPNIPSFDPSITAFANFQHVTIPESNTIITGTTSLQEDIRSFQLAYAQNFHWGMSAQLTYSSTYQNVNS